MTTGAITRQVQDLEKMGLIDRTTDERDGRAATVTLSGKGVDIARLSNTVRELHLRHLLDGWTSEDAQQIAPVFERLAEGLRRPVEGDRVLAKTLAPQSVSADDWVRRLEEM